MSLTTDAQGRQVIAACRTIAGFSETPDGTTRTFLSPPTRDVHRFLQDWMELLGMQWTIDAVGNLRGLRRGRKPGGPRLLIGSHIDTVPNAGAFDGVLGVVIALALIEALNESPAGYPLDYDIEVVAFSEEEGVRFAVPFIGSRALVGDIDEALLQRTDVRGITVAAAIEQYGLDPAEIPAVVVDASAFAYVEFHIEQGPVLEALGLRLGIVEAIVGQSRYQLSFHGNANHAGTTPMHLRRDALAGAAEWIGAVERTALATPGLLATVGRIEVGRIETERGEAPRSAANVIPGDVRVSLDVRHADDSIRFAATADILKQATAIAAARNLIVHSVKQFNESAVAMNCALADALEAAAIATGSRPHRMVSGAGHDALVINRRLPTAMLFLCSPGGISHHPDEAVRVEDVQAALDAGLYFLKHLDAAAISSSRP